MDRKSKKNPDRFCSICSNVVLPNHQAKITGCVKKTFRDYLEVKIEIRISHSLPTFAVQHVWKT